MKNIIVLNLLIFTDNKFEIKDLIKELSCLRKEYI